jgi:hypothetical protein
MGVFLNNAMQRWSSEICLMLNSRSFRHSSRKPPCILLHIPNMTLHKRPTALVPCVAGETWRESAGRTHLDLGMELLQVLHDRAINRAPKVCMVIGNHARLVPYIVENVLEASLAEELVPSAEGDLDDAPKLG